jgi:hypothetical protein
MRLKFSVPLFKSPLWVYAGKEMFPIFSADCLKYLGVSHSESGKDSQGRCCGSLVWLGKIELPVFAHEMEHYVDEVANHLGIDDKNREVQAYLITWAMKYAWPKIERLAGGRK